MYLMVEYFHKTLDQVVNEIGFLKDDIPHFLYLILSGVDHCHSSVIHRDLKPKTYCLTKIIGPSRLPILAVVAASRLDLREAITRPK
ncbi:hypothetical protein ACFX13_048173 [Malus domestica]